MPIQLPRRVPPTPRSQPRLGRWTAVIATVVLVTSSLLSARPAEAGPLGAQTPAIPGKVAMGSVPSAAKPTTTAVVPGRSVRLSVHFKFWKGGQGNAHSKRSKRAVTRPAKPTPTPTTEIPTPLTQQPTSGWPSVGNTGVPSGVTLTSYTGPQTITVNGTEIRNKVVTGTLTIRASGVRIVNTRIQGHVVLRSPKTNDYSFTIIDSEVHQPARVGGTDTGILAGNFRATRIEVTGGRRSIYCAYNCVVEDSLVHRQASGRGNDAHFSGIRMEQNGIFRHNTLICEAEDRGCSAPLTGYGDFAPVQNNLIENNLFIGGQGGGAAVCAYGGSSGASGGKPYGSQARNIRFVNNVFAKGRTGKCGHHGPIAHFDPSRSNNVWSGNRWDDGQFVSSRGISTGG